MKGRFPPAFIQQLKQSISLIDVAGENIELRKTGNRFMGRCPFHGDRSPSFSVNKDFYYCFGCKETGDVISFVMKLHGLSFEEACEDLAEKARIQIPETADSLTSEEEKALFEKRKMMQKAARVNHFASLQFYHQNLLKGTSSPLFAEARDYLKSRGISQQTLENFQLGVAGSESNALVKYLTQAKAPLEIARSIGLIRASQKQAGDYDFFRERLLFPLIDLRGRVCGFGGRILPSVASRQTDQKLPKYVNSAESDLFQKSKFLYGLYQAKRAIREEESVILVEGYFDTVALHQAGLENVVAPCGTSLTEDHLRTLSRLAKRIIVFFDQDEAGINATIKSMELGLKHGLLLYGIPYESKKDPDEFLLEDPVENLKRLKGWIEAAHPLLDFTIDRLFRESADDVEKRSQAIKQAVAWLLLFTDPVGKAVRADQLRSKWNVPEAALASFPTRSAIRNERPVGHRPPQQQQRSAPAGGPPRRRKPVPSFDRELLQFFVKFNDFGLQFIEARKQLPEKDTLSDLFEDTEVRQFVKDLSADPSGIAKLKLAPETLVQASISQELRSVIMEGLLQEVVPGSEPQLQALLMKGTYKAWARFSHKIRDAMVEADSRQDMEKFKELSEQFLDLQRKLKEFEDSYVSGKTD